MSTVGHDSVPRGLTPSIVRSRLCRLCLALTTLASIWTAAVVFTGGFVLRFGGMRVSSRTAVNPAIAAAVLSLLAWVLAVPGHRRKSIADEFRAILCGFTPSGARRAVTAALLAAAVAGLVAHLAAWPTAALVAVRSLHLPPVQSACALACSGLALAASLATSRRRRVASLAAILALFGALTVALPLDFQFAGTGFMGDGADYAKDREKFERYNTAAADNQTIPFKSHLGDGFLAGVDALLGRTDTSPETAYKLVSRLGGLLFIVELLIVLAVMRGSRRACRYVGLALGMPLVIGFFGYYEVGYLAVSAAAFPLLAHSLRTRSHDRQLEVAGGLQGLHAAFHGFGILGIAGGAFASLHAPRQPWSAACRYAAFALSAYLGWVLIYVVVLHLSVEADAHSSFIALRSLTESYYFDKRLVHPLLSWNGVAEVGMASLSVGVPLLVFGLARTKSRLERHLALLCALPGLLFLIVWWPSAGVMRDMDLLLGAFAGIGAAAWLMSRAPRLALQGWIVLALVHVILWSVVADRTMERIWTAS